MLLATEESAMIDIRAWFIETAISCRRLDAHSYLEALFELDRLCESCCTTNGNWFPFSDTTISSDKEVD